jgi:hypothetical protein
MSQGAGGWWERIGQTKRMPMGVTFALAAISVLIFSGCTTLVNPHPPSPLANTGFVDLYCESMTNLSWDVFRLDQKSRKMKPAYSKYAPLPGNVLRVRSPAGSQLFRVNIFNKANRGPAEIIVAVEDGKVTPVKLTLEHIERTAVDQKEYAFRGSAKGYLRGTKIVTVQNDIVRILANAEAPQPYRPKAQMDYWQGPGESQLIPTGR